MITSSGAVTQISEYGNNNKNELSHENVRLKVLSVISSMPPSDNYLQCVPSACKLGWVGLT